MSRRFRQFSARRTDGGRRREFRRLRLEALEPRACPAVQAVFTAGVLSVVGDAGPNVIEIFQPRDRAVEVTGDGKQWKFEGVDKVLIDTGDGDDTVRASKPKEIVVVGPAIDVHAGAGDDLVEINDGGPRAGSELIRQITIVQEMVVDLGAGKDEVAVEFHITDEVYLDVDSADGFDSVNVRMEHAFPGFPGGVRVAVADVHLEGGNNLVNAHMNGYDDVNFDGSFTGGDNQIDIGMVNLWVRDHTVDSTARVALDFDGSKNQGTVSNQGYGKWEVNIDQVAAADEATSAATQSPTRHFLIFVSASTPTSQGAVPTGSVTFIIDGNPTSPGSDSIEIHGQGFSAATVEADTGGGSDLIKIGLGELLPVDRATGDGDDMVDIVTEGVPQNSTVGNHELAGAVVKIHAGAGDDRVT